ncbi:MAG: hypothetical protein KDF56_09430 [Ottowia sp.]|nr:hypothetical protein [Ottowia sp.]
MEDSNIFAEVEAQGAKLGLPEGFYPKLLEEDDWSFVIKLNALVEAACSDALAARLHAPQLSACLATLDLGHAKHGKVALLRTLGAIEKEQSDVLQMLYELRNRLAHNISAVGFSFGAYINGMDEKQVASFVRRAGHGITDEPVGQGRKTFVLANPKLSMWLTVAEILACLHLEHDVAELRLFKMALQSLNGEVK